MSYTSKQLASALIDSVKSSQSNLTQITDSFITLLDERDELHRVSEVIEAIESVWKQTYGAATITVETAHLLTDKVKQKLEQLSEGVELNIHLNASLIGGARIRIDDRIIDGSIAGHLQQLKNILAS